MTQNDLLHYPTLRSGPAPVSWPSYSHYTIYTASSTMRLRIRPLSFARCPRTPAPSPARIKLALHRETLTLAIHTTFGFGQTVSHVLWKSSFAFGLLYTSLSFSFALVCVHGQHPVFSFGERTHVLLSTCGWSQTREADVRPGMDSFLWRVFRTRIGLGMVPAALNRHQSVRIWLWFCLLRIRNCHHIMQ